MLAADKLKVIAARSRSSVLYVAARMSTDTEYHILTYDLSDPTSPTLIGDKSCGIYSGDPYFPGRIVSMAFDPVTKTLCCTGDGNNGVWVYDASNPRSVSYLGYANVSNGGNDAGAAAYDGFYYVPRSLSDTVDIFDCTDPSNITLAATTKNFTSLTDGVKDIVIGSVKYATPRLYITSSNDDQVMRVDIADPYNPSEISNYSSSLGIDGARGIAIDRYDGDYLYVASSNNNRISVLTEGLNRTTNTSISGAYKAAIDEVLSVAYAADSNGKIHSVDVSDPNNSSYIAATTLSTYTTVWALDADPLTNSVVVLHENNGHPELSIFDGSDITSRIGFNEIEINDGVLNIYSACTEIIIE